MKVGVLGCGNMASIVVKSMYKNNEKFQFHTYTPSHKRSIELSSFVSGEHHQSLDFLEQMDLVLLGFKPQQLKEVSKQVQGRLKNKTIISMLAAVDVESLEAAFQTDKVLRIMPNTLIETSKGMVLSFYKSFPQNVNEAFLLSIKPDSDVICCSSEKELDELTAIFGCGPAYAFYFMRSVEEKLRAIKPDVTNSKNLIAKLFIAAGEKALSAKELTQQIDEVTSKKGVTIEAIESFGRLGVDESIKKSIDRAIQRSNELSKEVKNFP